MHSGQTPNQRLLLREIQQQGFSCSQFEAGKFKTGRYGATNQGPVARRGRLGTEPEPLGDNKLKSALGAKMMRGKCSVASKHMYVQGGSCVPVPQLFGVDAMQMGNVRMLQ